MISEIGAYFSQGCGRCARFDTPECSVQLRAGELAALRALCLGAGLEETVKWGHPCYVAAGRNIALIGAFRDDARLTFPEAALLSDPGGLLELAGPNSRQANLVRFRSEAEVAAKAAGVQALLAEAVGHAVAGRRVPRVVEEAELPEDLAEALDGDPALAEAFAALTPGRRRSYVVALSGAKQAATRARRIAGYRERILAGKGATER